VPALQELPRLRELALGGGYPEQLCWTAVLEVELKAAIGSTAGIRELALQAVQLAEPLGIGNQITAAPALCHVYECEGEWRALQDAARDALRTMHQCGVMRIMEPKFLAFVATAELELGNAAAARATAQAGVDWIRSFRCTFDPRSYAVLARAQLVLKEPAIDINATLDEYAALLASTGFHLYEGKLHELRARLLEREGQHPEYVAALKRAHDCYTRFGMITDATRVEAQNTGS
jgi:hypothetical protein